LCVWVKVIGTWFYLYSMRRIHIYKVNTLGIGFYEFQFGCYEDMRLAWSTSTINLKPGIMCFSDFIK
jgi:hypothetical protein